MQHHATEENHLNRRELLRSSALAGAGLMLGHKTASAAAQNGVRLNRLPATARHFFRERGSGTWRRGPDGLGAVARMHGNARRARPHAGRNDDGETHSAGV